MNGHSEDMPHHHANCKKCKHIHAYGRILWKQWESEEELLIKKKLQQQQGQGYLPC